MEAVRKGTVNDKKILSVGVLCIEQFVQFGESFLALSALFTVSGRKLLRRAAADLKFVKQHCSHTFDLSFHYLNYFHMHAEINLI